MITKSKNNNKTNILHYIIFPKYMNIDRDLPLLDKVLYIRIYILFISVYGC